MSATPWRGGHVASGGEEIYFEITGSPDAPAVLLTHGAGGHHVVWWQQVPALVDAGFCAVTWDCRGFGNSSYRSGVHGADAAVADMLAVLDELEVDSAHLVGQSMGGWWITAFALAHPSRVRSLTLCNTVGGLWTDALREYIRGRNVEDDPDPFRHPALSPSTSKELAFLYQDMNTFHKPPMAEIMGTLASTRVAHADLDALNIPVLMITGTNDELFPAKLVIESARMLRNARIVEVDGAGHSTYFEKPAEFNTSLLRFLGNITSQ